MLKRFIIINALFLTFFADSGFAQQGGGEGDVLGDSKRDVFIVLATTGGGAILGLSTLSFVEEPGDHLKNILVGGAIGTIVGVAFVAYSQATKSKDLYNNSLQQGYNNRAKPSFDTISRKNWHREKFFENSDRGAEMPFASYNFSF